MLSHEGSCSGLFVDDNNTIYCSMRYENIVVKMPLESPDASWTIVAGNKSKKSDIINETQYEAVTFETPLNNVSVPNEIVTEYFSNENNGIYMLNNVIKSNDEAINLF
ncbi:hypothetical protein I4U23_018095 [Adineta vaga]|nr:hypothetical protein I4U23_018095 [Adineta vaga]